MSLTANFKIPNFQNWRKGQCCTACLDAEIIDSSGRVMLNQHSTPWGTAVEETTSLDDGTVLSCWFCAHIMVIENGRIRDLTREEADWVWVNDEPEVRRVTQETFKRNNMWG